MAVERLGVGWRERTGEKNSKNDEKGTAWAGRGGSSGDERALEISAGRPRRGPRDGFVPAVKSTLIADLQSQTSNHGKKGQELAAWAEAERDLEKSLVKETTKAGFAGRSSRPRAIPANYLGLGEEYGNGGSLSTEICRAAGLAGQEQQLALCFLETG